VDPGGGGDLPQEDHGSLSQDDEEAGEMITIKVPKEISVGSYKSIQIYLIRDLIAKSGDQGCISLGEACICVDPISSPKNMRDTLIHECLHIVDHEYRVFAEGTDEQGIDRVAHGFSQLCDLLGIELDWSDIPLMRTDCVDFDIAIRPLYPVEDGK
jgi:hypothetical protein